MKALTTKPTVPLLWIDTWCILDLVEAIHGKDEAKKEKAEKIVGLIIRLTREKRLICPEGDQSHEIEVSNNEALVENARKLQAQISQGISLHFYASVENLQLQRMMEAYVKGESEVTFPWEDIFSDDPVETIDRNDKFIVSVHIPTSREKLDERLETNRSIAQSWEEIRQESLAKKEKYLTRLEAEFGGKAEAFIHVLSDLAAKTISNQEIDIDAIFTAMEVTGRPLSYWEQYSGKENDIKGLLTFLKSEEYKLIPSARIRVKLVAELVSGNETVSQGDVMDIHHMSVVLPFASYLVVDKRVRNRIEGKRTQLSSDFEFKALKWQELLPLLEELASK